MSVSIGSVSPEAEPAPSTATPLQRDWLTDLVAGLTAIYLVSVFLTGVWHSTTDIAVREEAAFWFVLGPIIGAVINFQKGYSACVGYVVGVVLGPLLIWSLLLEHPYGLRKCPFCAKQIKGQAVVCKFCGKAVLGIGNVPPQRANRGQVIGVMLLSLLVFIVVLLV
jgi:hypothetical protein